MKPKGAKGWQSQVKQHQPKPATLTNKTKRPTQNVKLQSLFSFPLMKQKFPTGE
ncbi:hypothetical protein HMPREF1981_03471, partial [Bacteroides pyogenes F0041]